jgi:hypothetical protein
VNSCSECPHYKYYSSGHFKCLAVDQIVQDKTEIAPFCPLSHYPAQIIANMETTIIGLRGGRRWSVNFALLTHIATRLKVDVHSSGRHIEIQCHDGLRQGPTLTKSQTLTKSTKSHRF